MSGADHGEDASVIMLLRLLAQAGRHVTVALGDQRREQARAILGKLGEGGLEEIALLELLHLILSDLLAREQPGEQSAEEIQALPKAQRVRGPTQGDADLAVDQQHRQLTRLGQSAGPCVARHRARSRTDRQCAVDRRPRPGLRRPCRPASGE